MLQKHTKKLAKKTKYMYIAIQPSMNNPRMEGRGHRIWQKSYPMIDGEAEAT